VEDRQSDGGELFLSSLPTGSALTLKFIHFLSYSIFDPSSTLNPKSTIAFPVKNYYYKGPFPKP
jgi:hypothetical protein